MTPLEYAPFCGPGALAAIAGGGRQQAATSLAFWQRQAGLIPGEGTPPYVLAAALLQRGHQLEQWSPEIGGWRTEGADEFARRMWRDVRNYSKDLEELRETTEKLRQSERRKPKSIADRIVKRILTESKPIRIERAQRKMARQYSVREWLHRRSVGSWILAVEGHWLAARAGEIIAGDTPAADEYGGYELMSAWRVLPRRVFQ